MDRYLIATTKSWNIENYNRLKETYTNYEFMMITDKADLTVSLLESYKPRYIFFPHWSWIIPEEIYNNYECVVFHSTDLPYGRGGSPLQNLIVRGVYNTKVSAIKVCSGIDAGPIYMKEPIDISEGNADSILSRISDVVFEKMIPRFLAGDLIPVKQEGNVVKFNRRKPEQSEIPDGLTQRQIYDYIRMLDGEGYPAAFKVYDKGKMLFTQASLKNGVVTAQVQFVNNSEDMTK